MSDVYELDPAEKLTTDAIGEPGQRVFYIQGRSGDTLVTVLVEKQQVAILSEQITDFLRRLPGVEEDAEEIDEDELTLDEPIEPAFRVGPMALGYDADRDLVILQCEEFVPVEESDDPDAEDVLPIGDGATVRFWATRAQMRALARRGLKVVVAGRPVCAACGEAIEPDGHFCPPSNGHRPIESLPETRDP